MKILYLNPDRGIPVLGDKGASVHVRAFVSGAAALGHEVVLACATLGSGNPAPPARIMLMQVPTEEEILNEACRDLGLGADLLSIPAARREIERLAYDQALPERVLRELDRMEFEPDVIYERHALFSRAGAVIAATLGVPRILEVNAPLVDEQARHRTLVLTGLALEREAESYRKTDSIIAVSEAVAAHVGAAIGSRGKVRVLSNGVDIGRFDRSGRREQFRTQLGVGEEPVIGFIGSFKAWHGVEDLLDAFELVLRRHPAAKLVAVGDGPELPVLRARAAAAPYTGQVTFAGKVPHAEIPDWLAAMDLTAAPYLSQENFYFSPLKIVESLAAARPVVAPCIGQIAELVSDGQTGLLFAPGSVAGCAEAICALLDDPARRIEMGAAGRRFAAGRDWTNVVRQGLAFAETIAEQSV
jgi:glycosyltransferase involved in cell wall biosynthesis